MRSGKTLKHRHDLAGSTFSDILGGFWAFLFYGLTLWGIIWSFYRHGPGDGLAAVFVPPYAWYRGVAALWEKPKWTDDFDVKTEQIGLVIENAVNQDASYQIQSREYVHDLHTWIKSLPAKQREQLHDASRNYGSAMRDYVDKFLSTMIAGGEDPPVAAELAARERVERFKSIKGFRAGWDRFVQAAGTLRDVPLAENAEDDVNKSGMVTAGQRAIAENRMHTYLDGMSRKMESIVEELFSN